MNITEIIEKKKKGAALNKKEIAFFIDGVCNGDIPDYQISALLMAICLKGMNREETVNLTEKMAHSGDTLDLSGLSPTADKHSTGGVGDKTSLVVAPIAAACGVNIAKMSGRGLGHTGGTVDKLESIPGFQTELSEADFLKQVKAIGIAMIAQSESMVPADKILYALRDVTATIDSIPLIASSIMSKKLAAGADIIELDVKTGSGAFMKTKVQAIALAREMVAIGKAHGKRTAALITDMHDPLGTNIGNNLEVKEALSVLRGEGAADIRELCLNLATNIIALAKSIPAQQARLLALEAIDSGAALTKFRQMVAAQGGDVRYIDHPELFEKAAYSRTVCAPQSGFLTKMDTALIGNTAALLGAGRQKKGDAIDFTAGIIVHKKTGDAFKKGEALATLYTNKKDILTQAEQQYLSALRFGAKAPRYHRLIKEGII